MHVEAIEDRGHVRVFHVTIVEVPVRIIVEVFKLGLRVERVEGEV